MGARQLFAKLALISRDLMAIDHRLYREKHSTVKATRL
jgi:hypothetical protein